ncbi:MAG: hypothetical protein ACO3C1_09830 [Ilumatobacteraceae bacterium]
MESGAPDDLEHGADESAATAAAEPAATAPVPVLAPVSDPVATARRRYGAGGAIMAAGMLGIDQVLGRRVKEEAPIVVAASDQPVDIDTEGITVPVDEATDVVVPPQPRPDPFARTPRRRRR